VGDIVGDRFVKQRLLNRHAVCAVDHEAGS
jgi:hypothetical protein